MKTLRSAIRPIVTLLAWLLIFACCAYGMYRGTPAAEWIPPAIMGLVGGITGYWFADRTASKAKGGE